MTTIRLFATSRKIKLTQSLKSFSTSARKLNASPWTQEGILKSPLTPIDVPNSTLYDYIWQNLDKWPERTMAVCGLTGRGYTYEQGFKLSNAFAANLRKKFRIRDGDAVAVMLPNLPDYPVVAMGILGAGGVITSINPIYTAHEVSRQILLSDAQIIITLPEITEVVRNALKMAKLDIPIIVIKTDDTATPDGTIVLNELSEDVHADLSCLKEVRRNARDICFLPYSSGTTGVPKGVELTNANIMANLEQVSHPVIRAHNDTTATHQDAAMAVLPFFHIYGASLVMFHKLFQGSKLVTLAKFQPEVFLKTLETYKTNILYVAPPIVLMMASHPAGNEKTFQHLEIIINGAAPLAASDGERLIKKVKRKLDFRQGYGLTETSPVVSLTPKGMDDYSCVGVALPNTDLRIVDENLKNLGPNEKGELLIRGPQVMKGYRNNEKANQEALIEGGWFRSGDLAVADENGIVTIADRLKELIKVKGFQVPPAELEAVLRDHPSVADAAVIGVPHKTHGETPRAFVVLKKGHNVPSADICDFVKERVAEYKRIYDVMFVDSVPKSAAGKILRRELKEKYAKLDFRQGYGLTETSPVVSLTPKGMDDYSCVGVALPNTDLRIVDENLKNLGPNEKGELLIRGPQVMKGYRNNEKANQEALIEGGWFRSGDLAVADENGIVTIADRLKELIKVKGFQVPPAELEAVLRDHPSVADAAVIGVPHKTHGETPRAFVVLKKGHNVPSADICDFVKERVAEYKRIYDVMFVDSVPKSAAGKILRRELKEKYA